MADRNAPRPEPDERSTLVAFLDYLRESIVLKVRGLDEEAVRRPMVPSGTSLLGLVKHLIEVEVFWFQWAYAGTDVVIPASDLEEGDTTESVVAGYEAACAASRSVVSAWGDLDRRAARGASQTAPEPTSMRWLLVHMIEETARHAGHADILREQIDGTVGR